MNIAVLADIHGNHEALRAVIADMNEAQADAIIVLGDLLFYGDEPQKCFETVKALHPLAWIRGNTDDWLKLDDSFTPQDENEERIYAEFKRIFANISAEARESVMSLNEKEKIEVQHKKLLCVHGSDRMINEPIGIMTSKEELEDLASRLEADIMLCAHTHKPFSASVNKKLIINVGSVGKPTDEPRACYCILRFEGNSFGYEIRRVEY